MSKTNKTKPFHAKAFELCEKYNIDATLEEMESYLQETGKIFESETFLMVTFFFEKEEEDFVYKGVSEDCLKEPLFRENEHLTEDDAKTRILVYLSAKDQKQNIFTESSETGFSITTFVPGGKISHKVRRSEYSFFSQKGLYEVISPKEKAELFYGGRFSCESEKKKYDNTERKEIKTQLKEEVKKINSSLSLNTVK